MEKILEVRDLGISFHTYAGEVEAVRGVSFYLKRGELLAVVGESGCGKTVTSKSIMKLLPDSTVEIKKGSEVRFEGRDIIKLGERELEKVRGKEISMIFQDPMTSLNPTMKIGDQIGESLMIHKKLSRREARKKTLEMLAMVNIPDPEERIDSYPHEFSGGMRQRVMIAIALSCEPKILIADEPTTALDVTIQAQIMKLIKNLQKKMGTSVILVTHDLGVVAGSADRVQVMYAGKVVERGTTDEIYYNPKHPYTWALLKSVPGAGSQKKSELYSLKGTPPDLMNPPKGCPFAARCDYCMSVCIEREPEETVSSGTHGVRCWLQHPMSPEVKNPITGGVR